MSRNRLRQRLAVLVGSAILMLGTVGSAAAAPQTRTIGLAYEGETTTDYSFDVSGVCDTCIPDAFKVLLGAGSWAYGATATGHVNHVSWQATTSTELGFDDVGLRQGRTLGLSDVLTPNGGTIVATGKIEGSAGLLNDPTGGTNFGQSGVSDDIDKGATWTAACAMPLPGDSPRTCVSNTQEIELAAKTVAGALLGRLDIVLSIHIRLEFTLSSDGIIAARALTFTGGSGSLNRILTFTGSTPSTLADPVALPCTQPAGSEIVYGVAAQPYPSTGSMAGRGTLHAAAVIVPIVGPDIPVVGANITTITAPGHDLAVTLTGNAGSATLGTLAANNIPPTPDAGGGAGHEYSGDQGTPIVFDGSGSSSPCGFPTLRWDFSDGGVAFGKNPQHAFQGVGTYSGLLTATDVTGLSATQTFSVVVANLGPVTEAGPSITAAWGRPVAFNGSATDPGTDDQATLVYAWDFGDGTPNATGGSSAIHAYTAPGTYSATFTAWDRHGSFSSDQRIVTIRARDVSLGSVGDTAATFDTAARLRASLVDEFGQAVNGRTVTFDVATVVGSSGSAVTGSSGLASTAWTPSIEAATYGITASFTGDSLYTAGSGSGNVAIARKATTTTYTGTLTGGANKTVTLSATLIDATGTPLAGRTITFKLGTQTTSALTSAGGVASVQLKLAQKNGTYPLTATWTPAGSDAARYLGSAASATFKLQAR
ncbi:MAG: PKD domain-containing protein [Chloroflexi bacterium]|nr:PKD domain-containing protein [Chloroflexota bacterium]